MKKIYTIIICLCATAFAYSQTVTLHGKVQTNTIGDQSGISIHVKNETYTGILNPVTEHYNTTTDSEGNFTITFDLKVNPSGLFVPYYPADLTITYSKALYENYKIENLVIESPETIVLDNVMLFPEGITVYQPVICVVTVTGDFNVNHVAWERIDGLNITDYIVFRSENEGWIALDTISFDSVSVFEDLEMIENPSIAEASYQIQAIFSDNTLSAFSEAVRAPQISLSIKDGLPEVEWMSIRDFTRLDPNVVERIIMFRGVTPTDIIGIDSVTTAEINTQDPLSFASRIDNTIEESGIYYYRIGYRLFNQCVPTQIRIENLPLGGILKAESGPFSLAMSNIAESEYIEIQETSIPGIESTLTHIAVSKSSVQITTADAAEYTVFSIDGRLVSSGTVQGSTHIELPSGVYTLIVDGSTYKILIP